jgi:hypothetical protein
MATKKKKPKPVLAWALVSDGRIVPHWCCRDRSRIAKGIVAGEEYIIRVEIRPAPKRKGVRRG